MWITSYNFNSYVPWGESKGVSWQWNHKERYGAAVLNKKKNCFTFTQQLETLLHIFRYIFKHKCMIIEVICIRIAHPYFPFKWIISELLLSQDRSIFSFPALSDKGLRFERRTFRENLFSLPKAKYKVQKTEYSVQSYSLLISNVRHK